jgi:hypothetical protein
VRYLRGSESLPEAYPLPERVVILWFALFFIGNACPPFKRIKTNYSPSEKQGAARRRGASEPLRPVRSLQSATRLLKSKDITLT